MSQAGFTPISLYFSTTPSAVPSSGNLVAGELALNTTDEKLYFKNAAGTVKLLASNASASGTSGTSILFGNGTGGFSNVTIGTGVSFAGGTLSATGTGGTVTSITVAAGTGMSGGGTVTTSGTVTLTNAGVTSLTAGTGISLSASTGAITVSASGGSSASIPFAYFCGNF